MHYGINTCLKVAAGRKGSLRNGKEAVTDLVPGYCGDRRRKTQEGHPSFWLEHQVVPLNERHTGEAASVRGTDEQLSFRQVKVPKETR